MTEDAQVNPSSDSKPTGDAAVVAKVFVGNLAFRTRNQALQDYFGTIGTVENARVVTQGKRSMGYGFVQFAKLEDAKTAVEQLHKSRLDDREINVELSTSKNTNNQRPSPTTARPVRPRTRFPAKKGSSPQVKNEAAEPKSSPKGEGEAKPVGQQKKRRPTKPKPTRSNAANSPSASGKSEAAPKSRANNPRVETGARQVSDTILYVTNIPFALDDEGLKQAFAEFDPVSANVIRRKRYNLSKGYGFVTFPDATKQEAALAKNKTSLGDPPREIIVRKAHLRPETPTGDDTKSEEAAGSPAN